MQGRQAFRRAMVVAEIALSLVLVVAATLLVQTMIKLQQHAPGFRSDHLFIAHIFVPPARYTDPADIGRFCDQLGRRVRAIHGVIDASVTGVYPTAMRWSEMFTFDGLPASRLAAIPQARFGPVDDRFVRTIGLSLASGRDFDELDQATREGRFAAADGNRGSRGPGFLVGNCRSSARPAQAKVVNYTAWLRLSERSPEQGVGRLTVADRVFGHDVGCGNTIRIKPACDPVSLCLVRPAVCLMLMFAVKRGRIRIPVAFCDSQSLGPDS